MDFSYEFLAADRSSEARDEEPPAPRGRIVDRAGRVTHDECPCSRSGLGRIDCRACHGTGWMTHAAR